MEHNKHPLLLLGAATLVALATSTYIFAAPPATPYAPNETLDPACTPGDPNCYVALVDNDSQTLSASGSDISISGGNTLSLGTIFTANDKQNLSISGSILNIERGTGVDLGTLIAANDDQTLSISGSTLSIANGNSITLPAGAVVDNLGNHTATQNLVLGSNYLSGDGGNEGLVVDAGGNVGIGTAAPARKVDIRGSSRITGDSGSTTLQLQPASNTWGMVIDSNNIGSQSFGLRINSGTNSSDSPLQIKNSSQSLDYMTIRGDGNVGIGTSAPGYQLHVAKSGSSFIGIDAMGSGNAGFYIAANSRNWSFMNRSDLGGGLSIADETAGANRLTLLPDGKIGVGTTSPVVHLDVTGAIRMTHWPVLCDATLAGAIRYDNGINKHQGCNGTTRNNLY